MSALAFRSRRFQSRRDYTYPELRRTNRARRSLEVTAPPQSRTSEAARRTDEVR